MGKAGPATKRMGRVYGLVVSVAVFAWVNAERSVSCGECKAGLVFFLMYLGACGATRISMGKESLGTALRLVA